MMPTLAGETVLLLKATALASTVAVVDLLGAATSCGRRPSGSMSRCSSSPSPISSRPSLSSAFSPLERRYAKAYRAA